MGRVVLQGPGLDMLQEKDVIQAQYALWSMRAMEPISGVLYSDDMARGKGFCMRFNVPGDVYDIVREISRYTRIAQLALYRVAIARWIMNPSFWCDSSQGDLSSMRPIVLRISNDFAVALRRHSIHSGYGMSHGGYGMPELCRMAFKADLPRIEALCAAKKRRKSLYLCLS